MSSPATVIFSRPDPRWRDVSYSGRIVVPACGVAEWVVATRHFDPKRVECKQSTRGGGKIVIERATWTEGEFRASFTNRTTFARVIRVTVWGTEPA